MLRRIVPFLRKIDLYDYPKIFKDRIFKNPIEKRYNEKLFNFYTRFVRPGDLCFDVGASYGNWTETFLKLGARVVSVEPQKIPARFLRRKFSDKIILITKALGSKKGTQKMFVSNATALSSLSKDWVNKVKLRRYRSVEWNGEIEIEIITLDELIKSYGTPNFCKIDVEGYELEVFKGLSQPIPMLSFEFTIPEFTSNAIECIIHLRSIGEIECNYSPFETFDFALEKWLSSTDFLKIFPKLESENCRYGDIYIKFI